VATYEKFNGIFKWANVLAGKVWCDMSPVATWKFVSKSTTFAEMCEKVSGRKLPLVLICSAAKAGKVKLAGARENCAFMLLLNEPLAAVRGVWLLNSKDGTRGMVKASKMPILLHFE
jgi:hypothetical protein